jgi:diguanylate cyclase (GGDEF)-like protein
MNYPLAFNAVLGSFLLIALILADYVRKYNTDSFLRVLFVSLLAFSLAAMICDFVNFLTEGVPGRNVHLVLFAAMNGYYFFQVMAYYFLFVFVDYLSYRDAARTRNIIRIVAGITFVHIIILAVNIPEQFYFYISGDNRIRYGRLYVIRMVISYLPAFFAILEIIFAMRKNKKYQVALVFLFLILASAGSTLDILLKTGCLIWPCLSSAYLYSYFFIVQSDSTIDSLTGLGNRFTFDEFIEKLSKSASRESWSIVMMDLDHFKNINDTLGHLEGDNALRDIAAIIKGSIRHSDFAARFGGDEFILAARSPSDIQRLLQRIQEAVDNQNRKKIRPYTLEMSCGWDVYTPGAGQSIDDFLKHIDALMYAEKRRKYA